MKKCDYQIRHILNAGAALVFIGFCMSSFAAEQSPIVTFKISDGPKLDIESTQDTNPCEVAGYGSICVKKGNKATVVFKLDKVYACGDVEGAHWNLSAVYLGGEGSDSKPGGWGGLSNGAAADFNADKTTGLVTISPANGGQTINFRDENDHSLVLWYRVDAVCRKGDQTYGDTISFDPRVLNGGRG